MDLLDLIRTLTDQPWFPWLVLLTSPAAALTFMYDYGASTRRSAKVACAVMATLCWLGTLIAFAQIAGWKPW
ncbi:hypothetical protein [Cellulosimicrobium sp. Marseille-Q4280]|uniref:hypothetical protein n=1 Tax=Cellulosimicrobium sp. Marseille-Q4280 TaxID=2937992 RepID=UPI002040EFFC|nr:hypothetical protein [Cellulosimicrobium sp. Marseille-Q4280]